MKKHVVLDIESLKKYLEILALNYEDIFDILPIESDYDLNDLVDLVYKEWKVVDAYKEEELEVGEETYVKDRIFYILTSVTDETVCIRVPHYVVKENKYGQTR